MSKPNYTSKGTDIPVTPLDKLKTIQKKKAVNVARVIGVSPQHYNNIKNHHVKFLTLENLYKLSGLFGCSAIQLLYILENNPTIKEIKVILTIPYQPIK